MVLSPGHRCSSCHHHHHHHLHLHHHRQSLMTAEFLAALHPSTTVFSQRLLITLLLLPPVLYVLLNPTEAKVFAIKMSQRVVTTQYGKLKGILITLPDPGLPQVEAYLGIEYASLLSGDLRFMPPTSPVGKWDGVRSAIKFKPVCPQRMPDLDELERRMPAELVDHLRRVRAFLERQHEECLNLNVYVPLVTIHTGRNESASIGLSVVLFVHGESYETGTGNAYDGSVMAAFGRMIVVTLNYRLGVLGFLSTGDAHASGNYGLMDIIAALHWISDNISSFGGDPNRVTVLGHRHGGALVNLLMLSPLVKGRGLFKRAIIVSGSALSTWAITSDPWRYTAELAERLNCSARPNIGGNSSPNQPQQQQPQQSALLLQCLKLYTAEDLVSQDIRAPKYLAAFGPTLDGRGVLPGDVRTLMSDPASCDQDFGRTPLIVAVGRDEGAAFLAERDQLNGVSEGRLRRVLRTYVWNTFNYHQQKILEILLHNYRGWDRPRDKADMRADLADLVGDGQIAAPSVELAQYHAGCVAAPTFLFSFGQRLPVDDERRPEVARDQGKELDYIFGAPLADGIDPFASAYAEADKVMAETVLTYWSTFIDTGSPSGAAASIRWMAAADQRNAATSPTWPPYDIAKQQYMMLGTPPRVQHHYRGDKMALWLDLVPRIHRPDGFDPRYHLLDDFDNLTSFEEDELMREINMRELQFTTSVPMTSPVTSTTTTTKMAPRTTQPSTVIIIPTKRDNVWTARSRRTTGVRLHVSTTPGPTPDTFRNPRDGESDDTGTTSSVGLTVAVGVALLCLNLVVFAAVYCQWKRLRQAKAPESDDFDKAGESEYLQGTKLDPPDVESASTENNVARLLTDNRSQHRTVPNDQRYHCGETLPLKVRNTPLTQQHHQVHGNSADYAVVERSTLPKRNSHYDRVTFERVSPTESRLMTPDVTSNHESSTLV